MTREERLELLKQIEKDIHVCSLESTFLEDTKSCAIHSVIEELEQEPKEITLEDVKGYCKPRCLTIISNELLYELTHPKIKAQEQESTWIPVSERLPENRGFYLVSTTDCITIMEFVNGWISQNIGLCNGYVKAWMPLPKPYESQEKEDK